MTVLVLSSVEAEGVRAALAAGKQVYAYTIDGERPTWIGPHTQALMAAMHTAKPGGGVGNGLVVPERYRAVTTCETCGHGNGTITICKWCAARVWRHVGGYSHSPDSDGRVACCGGDHIATPIDASCPDCVGGLPVVELTAECPNDCTRFGGKVPGHIYGSNWDWVPCQTCQASSRVSLGRATIQVLPVVFSADWAYWNDDQWPDHTCVIVDIDTDTTAAEPPFIYTPSDRMTNDLDIDSLPSPGQFVVVVEFKDNP